MNDLILAHVTRWINRDAAPGNWCERVELDRVERAHRGWLAHYRRVCDDGRHVEHRAAYFFGDEHSLDCRWSMIVG